MANPILLFTHIWEEKAEDITNQILDASKNETLEIWLNSPGGSVSAGWAIIAAMDKHNEDKNITVMGDASSMAFFMLLFADNVTAHDSSNFLIHRAASWWEDMMSEDELKDIENRNKIIRKKLEARIDKAKFEEVTGKTFDDIFDMENRLDVRLTAHQAKKIGLVHKIIKLDVKKRNEIESKYFHDIAALANPTNQNNNSNKNNMGLFSKDPVLLGAIGESQFVYSKLEVNAKIKALGNGEKDPITGTFEANDKKVTIVNDVITAIEDIDNKQIAIDTLTAKVAELTALVGKVTKKEVIKIDADKSKEQIDALTAQVSELTKTLAKAKITVSKPDLPEGEFQNDAPIDDLTVEERIIKAQNEAHEEKIKSREV